MCVAVDVEGYRHRGVDGQRRTQADLVALLDTTWRAAGGVDRQPKGDGEVAVLHAGADHSAVLTDLATHLRAGLAALPGRPLRLRVAAHVGHVEPGANGFVGHAVVRTCRMVDSAALRAALAAHPAAQLALMISDPVLEDVVGRERHRLRTADFRPVDVRDPAKSFAARAWIQVPGTVAPAPEPPADPPRFRVDVAAGGRVGAIVQVGEVRGGLVLPPLPELPAP